MVLPVMMAVAQRFVTAIGGSGSVYLIPKAALIRCRRYIGIGLTHTALELANCTFTTVAAANEDTPAIAAMDAADNKPTNRDFREVTLRHSAGDMLTWQISSLSTNAYIVRLQEVQGATGPTTTWAAAVARQV